MRLGDGKGLAVSSIERAAIIDVAPERLAREIAKEHIALQDCERKLADAERKTDGLRQEQARRRVEIGSLLIEAKRTIKHGGWLPYLAKLGIEPRRAQEWMQLAGWVETKCLMSVSAAEIYVDWLVGRNMSARDLSPAYKRLKGLLASRLEGDTGRKHLLPQPPWAAN